MNIEEKNNTYCKMITIPMIMIVMKAEINIMLNWQ